jgi:SAM-dependent methyltransferase
MKRLLQPILACLGKKTSTVHATAPQRTIAKPDYVQRHAECAARDVGLNGWHNLDSGDLLPGFNITAEDHVLDVGCGGAGHSHFCLLRGATVTFTDIDAKVVSDAQHNFDKLGKGKATGIVSDSYPLPVESGSASKIIATEVLEHVEDAQLFLSELFRVGKPGAQYFLTVPDAASENMQLGIAAPAYFEKPNHIRIINREQFAKLVTDAGLVVESHNHYGAYWSLWWLFFWNAGVDLSTPAHPLLEAWTTTWNELLNTPNALRVKTALDNQLPKSQVILARKP